MSHTGARRRAPRSAFSGYFTPRRIGTGELPAMMRTHILTGCMGSVWGSLMGGIICVYFGNAIGMTQLGWGILGGISAWLVAGQLLGAVLGERAGSRKRVFFWFAMTDRVLRLLGICTAYFLWRAGSRGGYLVLMAAVCVATFLGTTSNPPWYAWLTTIIPKEVQGTFWGRRDSWIALATTVVLLPSGYLMDLMPNAGKLEAAFAILVVASLVGFADLVIHGTIPEPPHEHRAARGSFAGILTSLRDRRFRPWLIFTAAWNFSQFLGGALCFLYFMENLGFKNNLLGGMIAINGVGLAGTMFAARRVGRMVDRYGIRRMLLLGHFFWSLLPLIWLLATPSTAVFWIGLASLVGGVFPAAANNAGIKLVTRFRPSEESAAYMAVSTTVGNAAGGIGSIVAGVFVSAMGSSSFPVLGLTVSAFPLLFLASGVLRTASVLAMVPRVRVSSGPPEEGRPFLLPLFFEGVPAISRFTRAQRRGRPPSSRPDGG
jgi:MFS family permease